MFTLYLFKEINVFALKFIDKFKKQSNKIK